MGFSWGGFFCCRVWTRGCSGFSSWGMWAQGWQPQALESRQVSRGSAGEYQADEQAGVARLRWQYQADERAGVARLSWRVSGRWAGRCGATQLASIRQMSRQLSRGSFRLNSKWMHFHSIKTKSRLRVLQITICYKFANICVCVYIYIYIYIYLPTYVCIGR